MPFDGLTLHALTCQLQTELIGAKIDKISQPEADEIILHTRKDRLNQKLLISASSSNARIYISQESPKENPLQAPMFLMILRKYLCPGRIVSIEQNGRDRVLCIGIEAADDLRNIKKRLLYIEIMGRHSNIILVDAHTGIIYDAARRVPQNIDTLRHLLPGKPFTPAPSQQRPDPLAAMSAQDFCTHVFSKPLPVFKALYTSFEGLSPVLAKEVCYRSNQDGAQSANSLSENAQIRIYNAFERMMQALREKDFYPCTVQSPKEHKMMDFSCVHLTLYEDQHLERWPNISQAAEAFYGKRDWQDRLNQRASALRKQLTVRIERLEHKLAKQLEEIQKADDLESLRKEGDLLTANIYQIEKGMREIQVEDFYQDLSPSVTYPLDPHLTPAQNIQKAYRLYNKMKSRKNELSLQMAQTETETQYLKSVLYALENAETLQDIENIREELSLEGYSKSKPAKKKKNSPKAAPLCFRASDGTPILVGRNNHQNDELTLRVAAADEMWLHTKHIAGSHVIVRAKADQVSSKTLEEAAMIAAWHSKARQGANVPVDYCPRKNVRKPAKARPGMVIYEHYNTLYVTPDELIIQKLRCENEENSRNTPSPF